MSSLRENEKTSYTDLEKLKEKLKMQKKLSKNIFGQQLM